MSEEKPRIGAIFLVIIVLAVLWILNPIFIVLVFVGMVALWILSSRRYL